MFTVNGIAWLVLWAADQSGLGKVIELGMGISFIDLFKLRTQVHVSQKNRHNMRELPEAAIHQQY